jgi:hypothetical protein
MATNAFPLSDVITVEVSAASASGAAPSFNQGLIVGSSTVISHAARVSEFNGTTSILQAGFSAGSPEVTAATLYFGQSNPPASVFVGRQDLTALSSAVGSLTVDVGGENYKVGDVVSITQNGATAGQATVTGVTAGVVNSLSVISGEQGTAYTAATGVTTTGGSGTGLTVNIVTLGESALEAIAACRAANGSWYGAYVCGAASADHLAIAPFIESASTPSTYFFNTADAAVLNGTAGNVMLELQSQRFTRTLGLYSTTQGGNAPNNAFAGAGVLGLAMGLFTGLPNSFFTLKFKSVVGVAAEPLTPLQRTNIESANGNIVGGFGNGSTVSFTWIEQGTMASGLFFDQRINRDFLASNIAINVVDLLVGSLAVQLTDPGVQSLINTVNAAVQTSVGIGYVAPGVWTGQALRDSSGKVVIANGTSLPTGFQSFAASVNSLTQAQKAARQAPPITTAINEGGAIHSVAVTVNVQL